MKTKKTTKAERLTDQRPICCQCGGRNVETNAWIEYREDGTAAVVNSEGPISDAFGNWCHDCDDNTPIEFGETTPADDARRQSAEAARDAGPELLAALRWAVEQVSDDLDPDHQAAIAAARALVERLS